MTENLETKLEMIKQRLASEDMVKLKEEAEQRRRVSPIFRNLCKKRNDSSLGMPKDFAWKDEAQNVINIFPENRRGTMDDALLDYIELAKRENCVVFTRWDDLEYSISANDTLESIKAKDKPMHQYFDLLRDYQLLTHQKRESDFIAENPLNFTKESVLEKTQDTLFGIEKSGIQRLCEDAMDWARHMQASMKKHGSKKLTSKIVAEAFKKSSVSDGTDRDSTWKKAASALLYDNWEYGKQLKAVQTSSFKNKVEKVINKLR